MDQCPVGPRMTTPVIYSNGLWSQGKNKITHSGYRSLKPKCFRHIELSGCFFRFSLHLNCGVFPSSPGCGCRGERVSSLLWDFSKTVLQLLHNRLYRNSLLILLTALIKMTLTGLHLARHSKTHNRDKFICIEK